MIELSVAEIMRAGAELLADPSAPNPEYDRAIAELTTELIGLSTSDYSETVLAVMRRRVLVAAHAVDGVPWCDRCGAFEVRWRLEQLGACDSCLLTALWEEGVPS